jgi:hypothetical protein
VIFLPTFLSSFAIGELNTVIIISVWKITSALNYGNLDDDDDCDDGGDDAGGDW